MNPMHCIVWKLSLQSEMHETALWGRHTLLNCIAHRKNVSLKVSTLCHCFSIPTQVGVGGVTLVHGNLRVKSWSSVLEKIQKYH